MEATGVFWKPVVRHEAPFDLVGIVSVDLGRCWW
jgi:hypothetical protein